MSGFDEAFLKIIGHEGLYSNDPRDPGGETKYGISARSYPDLDIAGLTLDQAKAIYLRDFWDKCRGDELPYVVALQIFDGAVNSGVKQSIRWMQTAAEVAPDGVIGPVTLSAWRAGDPLALAARFNGARLRFMTDLARWPVYSKGWARRIAGNLLAVPLERVDEDAERQASGILAEAPGGLPETADWLVRVAKTRGW